MKYLQCRSTLVSHGRTYQDIVENAEVVAQCSYDIDGRLAYERKAR